MKRGNSGQALPCSWLPGRALLLVVTTSRVALQWCADRAGSCLWTWRLESSVTNDSVGVEFSHHLGQLQGGIIPRVCIPRSQANGDPTQVLDEGSRLHSMGTTPGGSVSGNQSSRRAPTCCPAPGAWAWFWISLWVKFHWPDHWGCQERVLRNETGSPFPWWLWCHLAQLHRAAVTWGTGGSTPKRSQLPNRVFLGGCSYQGPNGRFQKVFLKVVIQEIA